MPDIWPTTYFFWFRAMKVVRNMNQHSVVSKLDRGAYWYVYDSKTGFEYA